MPRRDLEGPWRGTVSCCVALGLAFAACGGQIDRCKLDPGQRCGPATAKVVRVIDGDTVELEGSVKVRYIGVDTPELTNGKELFSEEARDYNRSVVEGIGVALEYDEECRDRYQRLLCYVCVGETMINEELLRRGLARTLFIPPNTRYVEAFEALEAEAKQRGLGIWSQ